jgi:hypothetical protein
MNDLHKAALAALDALENHTAIKHPQQRSYRDEAIEALRAALKAPRQELSVSELQQALLDVGLIYPDAIDDPEGYDGGDTLERIEMLHVRLRSRGQR